MAAGEGVEPSSSSSKPDVLPVTPSRNQTSPTSQVQCPTSVRLTDMDLLTLDIGPSLLVAAEGIEPSSLDYRSNALPLSYTARESNVASPMSKVCLGLVTLDFGRSTLDAELVDPAGLKPAPNGLKVRCSVTRAPGQQESKVPCPKFQSSTFSNCERL